MKRRRAEKLRLRNPSPVGKGVMGGIGEQPGGVLAMIPIRLLEDALVRTAPTPADKIAAAIDPIEYAEQVAEEMSHSAPPAPTEEDKPMSQAVPAVRGPLTDAVREEIAEAYRAGLGTAEIAKAYDIGQATLYAIVRKAGLPLRGKPGPRPKEEESVPVKITKLESLESVQAPPPNGLVQFRVEYSVVSVDSMLISAANLGEAYVLAKKSLQAEGSEVLEITSVSRWKGGE